jgi:alpha-L-rhamnosidase
MVSDEVGRRGTRQTAYRVLVASTAILLAENHGDLWDSGRVQSAQSNQQEYADKPLRSSQQAF